MRNRLVTPLVLCALLFVSTPAFALTRWAVPLEDGGRADAWTAGSTCNLTYYNFCTGWLWVFSDFLPRDQFGVCFRTCCGVPAVLTASWHWVVSGVPAGWGFTGTLAVSVVDANFCPSGAPLQSQPFLPMTGWNGYGWNAWVPADFAIHAILVPDPFGTPLALATDHPAPGPTGPAACGTCYPATRENHSYYYGPDAACPGAVFFNDGACDAQLLWDCNVDCPVGVEQESWGHIKNMYR